MKNKFVLISVYNKKNLKYLCDNLDNLDYKFISTGNTARVIKSFGYRCLEISKLTKSKEILDGRVKTLNHKIYGSILFKRDNHDHIKDFKSLGIPKIDIVIVNMYDFKKVIKHTNDEKIIEMIDIGGSALIRASSKNYKFTTTISDVEDYSELIRNLKKNDNVTDINFRKKMATKAFELTTSYDNIIFQWFKNGKKETGKKNYLKYGENPGQRAYLSKNLNDIFKCQLNGKDLSYNNILDIDSGIDCINEFKEPSCVIVKHTNPCGVSSSKNINDAFLNAYKCDSKSAFGGIVILNRKVNLKLAKILSKFFFEIIVCPKFDNKALSLLSKKNRLILLEIGNIKLSKEIVKSTNFGLLHQSKNTELINKKFISRQSTKDLKIKSLNDVYFGIKVAKHLKSNAIVLVKNKQCIGIGSGQTNRFAALKMAIQNAKKNKLLKNYVCVSDGFFPFTDSIKLLNKNFCKIIVQPSGSINDKKNVDYANNNNIALYYMKQRMFKH